MHDIEHDESGTHADRTYDLLDDLAGGVQVDQTLVNLELVAIPGLRTLTARLARRSNSLMPVQSRDGPTHSLTGGDLEDLGGKADGALDAELLVLRAVDEVRGNCPFA